MPYLEESAFKCENQYIFARFQELLDGNSIRHKLIFRPLKRQIMT